jgi:hypothetical protein
VPEPHKSYPVTSRTANANKLRAANQRIALIGPSSFLIYASGVIISRNEANQLGSTHLISSRVSGLKKCSMLSSAKINFHAAPAANLPKRFCSWRKVLEAKIDARGRNEKTRRIQITCANHTPVQLIRPKTTSQQAD